MAANPTPTNDHELLALCNRLADGCQALETEVGLKQNIEEKLRADIAHTVAARSTLGQAKVALGLNRTALRRADATAKKIISHCRLRLTQIFGTKYSAQWESAGFPDQSSQVPETHGKRSSLLAGLGGYFALNPAHQSTDMGATAAICHAAHKTLSDARSSMNQAKSDLRTAVKEHRKSLKALRKRMRGLIRELHLLLSDNDPRWHSFGLKLPARIARPDQVTQVTLTALGKGKVLVEWSQGPRAARFRIMLRRADVEGAEFENIKTVHDSSLLPNLLLAGFNPGENLEVRVIAANDADEALPSPVATVVVS